MKRSEIGHGEDAGYSDCGWQQPAETQLSGYANRLGEKHLFREEAIE